MLDFQLEKIVNTAQAGRAERFRFSTGGDVVNLNRQADVHLCHKLAND